MTALRSALASVLLAVLAMGGVVLPSTHRAAHGLEVADARAAHATAYHGDAVHGETHAEAPCPPAPNEVDCAVCVGLSVAADLAVVPAPLSEDDPGLHAAYVDWVRTVAAMGAGARAPPVG